jgi:hypothetical protein
MAEKYEYQGIENDQLFEANYEHEGDEGDVTCEVCKDLRMRFLKVE